jgi:hypothetical protein
MDKHHQQGLVAFRLRNAEIDKFVTQEFGLDINAERIEIIVPVKLILRHLRILFL